MSEARGVSVILDDDDVGDGVGGGGELSIDVVVRGGRTVVSVSLVMVELVVVVKPAAGHSTSTKVPCIACPNIEVEVPSPSPHTFCKVSCTASMASAHASEQLLPLVKSALVQDGIGLL